MNKPPIAMPAIAPETVEMVPQSGLVRMENRVAPSAELAGQIAAMTINAKAAREQMREEALLAATPASERVN